MGARHSEGSRSPRRRAEWAAAAAAVMVVGAVAGYLLIHRGPAALPPPIAPDASVAAAVPPVPSPGASPSAVPDWAADFTQLQQRLHAKIGIAVRAVGPDHADPVVAGEWRSGPAWSTSKVPLAAAALRNQLDPTQPSRQMIAAITESDNAAAEAIWEQLGDPATAADQVQQVLRDSGDQTTTVESRRVRPEYTAFGQTVWPLTAQTQFLATAACDPRDAPVLTLMGQVESDQRWGLGEFPGARIKGGWGPSRAGGYLVRQIGIVHTPKGLSAVAVAAEPDSGSFADGTRDLTEIAHWLQPHLAALPAGQCSP